MMTGILAKALEQWEISMSSEENSQSTPENVNKAVEIPAKK